MAPLKIVVAGASGFVGRALVEKLARTHEVIGLTRSKHLPPPSSSPGVPGLRWMSCELFSLLQVEEALAGADVAFYLVHSMLPHAHLVQGSFADFDLILADNFARAAKQLGVKHVIYLGGLVPEGGELSPHLRSRLEVEETFRARGLPFTAVRASIVIGPSSSSFRIVERLVKRLPVMITPGWTLTPTQPIALADVVELLERVVLDPEAIGRVADVGGPDVLSYRELIQRTGVALGRPRRTIPISLLTPKLSKLWVSMVTQTPMALVSPLVESLRLPMVVRDDWLLRKSARRMTPMSEALAASIAVARSESPASSHSGKHRFDRDVRSVQRFVLPRGLRARDVSEEYFRWLGTLSFVDVRVSGQTHQLFVKGFPRAILELSRSVERSSADRELLYLTGGLLSRPTERPRGRFEFREVLGGKFILAAIHSFMPRLPWQLYKYSQALVHLNVMRRFGEHLETLNSA
ncbi:MAG: NAD(P)H-binding protein [Myxococcaceae bacterium]